MESIVTLLMETKHSIPSVSTVGQTFLNHFSLQNQNWVMLQQEKKVMPGLYV